MGNHEKIQRVIFVSFVILLFLSFLQTSRATKPSITSPPPPLKMDLAIIHDGNWWVGKENKIVFKFQPLEEVEHKAENPDDAIFGPDSTFTLISGNLYWSGRLEKGKEYSITVTLKPTTRGKFYVEGSVRSGLDKIYSDAEQKKLEEEHAERMERNPQYRKRGIKIIFPTKDFRNYNTKGVVIKVRGSETDPIDTTWHEVNGALIRPIKGLAPIPGSDSFKIEIIKDSTKIHYSPQPK